MPYFYGEKMTGYALYLIMEQKVSFTYKIADLQKEVEKRTSYLGKSRVVAGSDGTVPQHQLDRMSLTEGESFLFDEYLKEAATETYDWVRRFGGKHGGGLRIFEEATTHSVQENYGLGMVVNGIKSSIPYLFTEVVRWNAIVLSETDEEVTIQVSVMLPNYTIDNPNEVDFVYNWTLRVIVGVEDTPFEEVYLAQSENLEWSITVPKSSWGSPYIKKVDSVLFEAKDITPAAPLSVAKGEYIEYMPLQGETEYYIAKKSFETSDVFRPLDWRANLERLESDVRASVVFRLEVPRWNDNKMFDIVDNRLREALLNYVMWRWFETVLQEEDRFSRYGQKFPHEAERYHDKWEDMAHQAQLGMNAEDKILKRRYNWF